MNDGQLDRFHHIQALPKSETNFSFVCDCPNWHHKGCFHIHLFKAYTCCVLQMDPFSSTPHPPAFLITHSLMLGTFIFSVCSTCGTGLQGGKQAIVSLFRDRWWSCCSCPNRGRCHHEAFTIEYASCTSITDKRGELDPDLTTEIPSVKSDKSSTVPFVKSPILHLQIPPPCWCHLSTDTTGYPSLPLPSLPPSLLPLNPQSQCCCRSMKPEGTNTTTQSFIVFGVRMATSCEIEVANCMVCHHHL